MNSRQIVSAVLASTIIAATSTPAYAGETEAALLGAVLGNVLGGKTTLGSKGGEIEGQMIGARLLQSAAESLADKRIIGDQSGILVLGDENINLQISDEIQSLVAYHGKQMAACPPPPKKDDKDKKPRFTITGIVDGGVLPAIKSAPSPTTVISGYTLTPADSALLAALLSNTTLRENLVRIGDFSEFPKRDGLRQIWDDGAQLRQDQFSACSKTEEGKARLAAYDAFAKEVTALGEKGTPSLLTKALQIEAARAAGTSLVRVKVEAEGGSVINSDNLLTRLGLPAISLTGATVVSYRVIDPTRGKTTRSGLLVCTTPRTTLRTLHNGNLPKIDAANCHSA